MSEHPSAELCPTVSREQAENAFRAAMNLYIGRGRRYSSMQIEKGCGISHRVIDCFRSYRFGHPDYRPLHMGAMFSIAKFLGPEFTNEWLGMADQVAVSVGGIDHDDMARACIEFAAKHAQARHPASECGVEIGPVEDAELTQQRARLVA